MQNSTPLIGDLILLTPTRGEKSPNVATQTLLRAKRAYYSHVAISVGEFFAIHAMPVEGVHVVPIKQFSSGCIPGDLVALRNRHVAADNSLQLRLRARLFAYYGQAYNLRFWLRRHETASFCSELASKAYSDVKLPLSHRQPKYVLPVDLQNLPSEDWLDVTHVYLQIGDDTRTPLQQALDEMFAGNLELRRTTEELLVNIEKTLHEAERDNREFHETLNELRSLLRLPKAAFNAARDTWIRHAPNRFFRRSREG